MQKSFHQLHLVLKCEATKFKFFRYLMETSATSHPQLNIRKINSAYQRQETLLSRLNFHPPRLSSSFEVSKNVISFLSRLLNIIFLTSSNRSQQRPFKKSKTPGLEKRYFVQSSLEVFAAFEKEMDEICKQNIVQVKKKVKFIFELLSQNM